MNNLIQEISVAKLIRAKNERAKRNPLQAPGMLIKDTASGLGYIQAKLQNGRQHIIDAPQNAQNLKNGLVDNVKSAYKNSFDKHSINKQESEPKSEHKSEHKSEPEQENKPLNSVIGTIKQQPTNNHRKRGIVTKLTTPDIVQKILNYKTKAKSYDDLSKEFSDIL